VIRAFAAHPTAANLLTLLLVVMGLFALPQLQRDTFPEFGPIKVEVRVIYPGSTAEEVEEAICQRVEDVVDGVGYVKEVTSEAREGLGVVTVEMNKAGSLDTFINEIKTEVEAINDFPERAEKPVVRELEKTDQVVSIAVSGPADPAQLKAYCEQLERRLQQDPEISQVELHGFSDHHLRVHVPTHTLLQFGLSVNGLAETISNQSVNLPAGAVEARGQDVLVRFQDQRRSVDELRQLVVVAGASGGELRLGEIAQISDTFEVSEQKTLLDGKRAGLLQVTKTKTEDTLRVFAAVKAFVEREQALRGETVRLVLTRDMASNVQSRLDMLVTNGWQGLLLVFITLALFFKLRFSFWVAFGLPVSFLGAFFFFPPIDYSINMITMVALLLALGLLMDDAIVIAENVMTHLRRGKSPLDAAIDGTSEVKWGVLSSFLTTVVVFAPLSTMQGDIGEVLGVMPVVLLLVLGVSLIEAFLILPNHLGHALDGVDLDAPPGPIRAKVEAALEWGRESVVGKTVDWAVGQRYLVLGLTFMAFLVSASMLAGGFLKFRAFPDTEGDTLQVHLLLPQGTPITRTEAVADVITRSLSKVVSGLPAQPGGAPLVKSTTVQFATNAEAHETGAHVATITVNLLGAELRSTSAGELLSRWRDDVGELTDVLALKFGEPAGGPAGRAIDVRLKGEDLARLKGASLEVQAFLRRYEGVNDLSDDLRPGKPELRLALREGATTIGLTAGAIAAQLRAALQGSKADTVQVGPESYEIDVRLAPEDRDSLGDIDGFHIALPDGRQVPLSVVAEVSRGRGYARVARVEGRRTVTIQGDVESEVANTAELMSELKGSLVPSLAKDYPDVELVLEGEAKESETTARSLQFAFLLGLIGVFVILSFQFRSYIEPVVVMAAIPLALIGVIAGHMLMGLELSMPSMVGFVSLAGVVVNDSILLLLFLRSSIAAGESVPDAAKQASRDRFRAVLLTSITTVAGLTPLLTERSSQAQILIPLAASIVFGMAAATVLVLIVIPCLYTILDDFGLTRRPDAADLTEEAGAVEVVNESPQDVAVAPAGESTEPPAEPEPSAEQETPAEPETPAEADSSEEPKPAPDAKEPADASAEVAPGGEEGSRQDSGDEPPTAS
jgi:hydrophobic/amphiphilic exporter-1 (mainly G- bacteria), HAE1 family